MLNGREDLYQVVNLVHEDRSPNQETGVKHESLNRMEKEVREE